MTDWIQVISTIIQTISIMALVGITWWYAKSTRILAELPERQRKECSSMPFKHRYAIDEKRKKCKIFLAIKQSVDLAFQQTDLLEKWKSVFKIFFEEFERLKTPRFASSNFKDIFGFQSTEWIIYKFYRLKEDKEVNIVDDRFPINDLENIIKNAFGPWLEPDYDSSSFRCGF